ncbi:MAG: hypothetical protein RIR62_1415 [Pseudomonadota bacterium]
MVDSAQQARSGDGADADTAFWDLARPLDPALRMAGWLRGLATVLAGSPALRLVRVGFEGFGTALALPEHLLPSDAVRRARDEALSRGQPALAGHLPGQTPGKPGITAIAIPLGLPVEGPAAGSAPPVLTLEAEIPDAEALSVVMTQLFVAAGWVGTTLLHARNTAAAEAEQAAIASLQAVAAFVTHRRFSEAARALMTHLADRFGCDRVALGLARGRRIRLRAISHAGNFSRSVGLVRRIEAAMDETLDQERVLLWPLPETEGPDLVTERLAELAEGRAGHSVLAVPLFDGVGHRGVIVFERSDGKGFDPALMAEIEALCSLLTPVVLEKRENDRWLVVRALVALRDAAQGALGRRHLVAKSLVLAGVLGLAALFVIRGDRVIVAEAVVQGTEMRTLSAAFAGFIAEAPHREGDRIEAGALLVRMDDREFTLELTRLAALRAQTELELDKAISERNRAEAGLVESRLRQIAAQIALSEQQIARSRIVAPFDGVVVSGDLSRSIGRSVEQGEPLLTVAPLREFRVDLMLPEDSVNLVQAGQAAALKVTPLPERRFDLTLAETMPVARYENGQTRYQAEARFAAPPEGLVPGMAGVARIATGRASLATLWFGPLADRLRLWLWRNMAF